MTDRLDTEGDDLGATRLDRLGLSVRSTNALATAGLTTLAKIVATRPDDLLALRAFGRTCLEEIEGMVASFGLQLGTDLALGLSFEDAPGAGPPTLTDAQRGWLTRPISALVLSQRAHAALEELGLEWLGDLSLLDPSDLASVKNLGRRSILEIEGELQKRGLDLGLTIPEWSPAIREDWTRRFGRFAEETLRAETSTALRDHGAKASRLGSELRALAHWLMGDRNGAMMIRLLGWNGEAPKTLEEVGQEFGLTRERVRQLGVRFQRAASLRSVPPRSLLKAYEAFAHLVPFHESEAEMMLDDVGAGIDGLHVGGILKAMELYGVDTPYRVHGAGDMAGFLCDAASEELGLRTVQEARRSTSRRGCFRLAALAAAVGERMGRTVTLDAVRRVIDAHRGVEWLDVDRQWGWAPDVSRSRLFRVIRQVIAVAPCVSLADLRSAIRRDLHMEGFTPPKQVLEEILSRLSWTEYRGGSVRACGSIAGLVPGSNYAILRDVLAEAGGVMDRYSLIDACCRRGMNLNSCMQFLSYCPLVVPLDSLVFSLIGTDVSPGTVERLRPEGAAVRVAKDHGWTVDGLPWVAVTASRSVIVNGLINIPTGLQSYVNGPFVIEEPAREITSDDNLEGEGDERIAHNLADEGPNKRPGCRHEVRVNGQMVSGLRGPLAERGADVGETVILVFDPKRRMARLEIGDEILRSEFE